MTIPTRSAPIERLATRLQRARRQASRELFEHEGLDALFKSARNLLTGAVIVAAGLHAAHHEGPASLPVAQWTLQRAGWLVLAIGIAMLALNLIDGLRRLSQRRSHLALRVFVTVLYLGLTLRLTQVIVLFRYGM